MSRGHVRQRAAGSWTLEASAGADDAGRRVRISRTVHGTRRDADRALTELLRDVDRGTVSRAGAEDFDPYLGRWLRHMRTRVRPGTWSRYEGIVRVHVIPRIGRVRLERIRPHHLQRVVDEMLAAGASPASAVKCHRVMASALGQAVRWQLLAANPAAGASPPAPGPPDLRIPTATEMRILVDAAADTSWGIPILVAATTGARRSEVLALRWPDVDLDVGVAAIQRGKTAGSRRTVSIPPSTVVALKRHRKEQAERRLLVGPAWQDLELVVDRGDGGPVHPVSLSHAFAAIAERVGLGDVRLHDLRHGYAVALLQAGVNPKVVSSALGHSRVAFTLDCYASSLPALEGDQVAAAIEEALGGER
jgi:integrase